MVRNSSKEQTEKRPLRLRCNRCKRPLAGSTPSDGACECGGLIEAAPDMARRFDQDFEMNFG